MAYHHVWRGRVCLEISFFYSCTFAVFCLSLLIAFYLVFLAVAAVAAAAAVNVFMFYSLCCHLCCLFVSQNNTFIHAGAIVGLCGVG